MGDLDRFNARYRSENRNQQIFHWVGLLLIAAACAGTGYLIGAAG